MFSAEAKKIESDKEFKLKLEESDIFPLYSTDIEILQINVGRKCNMNCKHCHLDAGPDRVETMNREVLEKCLDIVDSVDTITTIDITGGAPEMNTNLEWFLNEIYKYKKRILVRTNLSILDEPEYKHFIDIYSKLMIEIVGSLPHFDSNRYEKMRGENTFDITIRVLKKLNEIGYGKEDTGLILDLVHNPLGAYIPGKQKAIEDEYKRKLLEDNGIVFNNLFCITNMPLGRFLEFLIKTDNFNDYFDDLVLAFNPIAAKNIMCKNTLSIKWDGTIYDCDFNQSINLPISCNTSKTVFEFDANVLSNREIEIRNHCFGCTAGSGSSCQGSTN